jgi:hypothetical protein
VCRGCGCHLLFGFEDSRAFRIETGSAAESQQNKREREKKKKNKQKTNRMIFCKAIAQQQLDRKPRNTRAIERSI